MAIWRLTPDLEYLDHPSWTRSLNSEPVSVIASDEEDARGKSMAMENNDNMFLRIPGADVPLSPWKDPMLVHAAVASSTRAHTDRFRG